MDGHTVTPHVFGGAATKSALGDRLREVWVMHLPSTRAKVANVARAVELLGAPGAAITDPAFVRARGQLHQLHGATAAFGHREAEQVVLEIQELFRAVVGGAPADVARLRELCDELRRRIEVH